MWQGVRKGGRRRTGKLLLINSIHSVHQITILASNNFPSLRNDVIKCSTLSPISICQMEKASNISSLYLDNWGTAKAVHQFRVRRSENPKYRILSPLQNWNWGMSGWRSRPFKFQMNRSGIGTKANLYSCHPLQTMSLGPCHASPRVFSELRLGNMCC